MKNSMQRKQATKAQSNIVAREAMGVTVLTQAQTAQVGGGQIIGVNVPPPRRARIN